MNFLDYSVAWIDDQPQAAKGYEDNLRSKLARQGLELRVEWVTSKAGLDAFLKALDEDSPYDLILVDWKLGQMAGGGSGATVAKDIRDQHSYASIVFYSAGSPQALRGEIAEQLIDGVWCVNRNYFVAEAWHTIQATLRRVDLNAMRGLFVSAVAEFDHKMKGALMTAHGLLDGHGRGRLAETFVKKKLDYARKSAEDAEKLDARKPLHSFMDAAGTFELYSLLLEVNAMVAPIDAQHRAASALLAQFEEQIITPRNDLAHAKADGSKARPTLTRGGRTYDWQRFSELRGRLMEHHDNLSLIAEKYVPQIAALLNKPKP